MKTCIEECDYSLYIVSLSLSLYIYIHTHTHIVVFVVHLLSHVQLFCHPMGYSPSGFFVHGISQARILEWVAISFSMGSSRPRDWTLISCTGRQVDSLSLYQAPGKPLYMCVCIYTHTHSICYIYIYLCIVYIIHILKLKNILKIH